MSHRLTVLLASASFALASLAGCATVEPSQQSRLDAPEPTTGSNLPRKDRKSVSNVTVTSGDALRDLQDKGQGSKPPAN